VIWEYTSLRSTKGGHEEQRMLNQYGAAGWELVSVMIGGSGDFWFYFKRPVRS
jgi:hypothetical protein